MRLRRKEWLCCSGAVCMLLVVVVYQIRVENVSFIAWLYPKYGSIMLSGNLKTLDTFPIPDDGIYFLETSGLPYMSLKQLCSVESAAKYHPTRPVVVAINSPQFLVSPVVATLEELYDNLHLVRLDPLSWLNGTALSSLLASGAIARSLFKVSHLSDVLRYATLYKHGGIYLDLDMITTRSLNDLNNAIGIESYVANGAAMIFDKEHDFLADCINETMRTFDGNEWGANGPHLVSRVLKRWCGISTLIPKDCKDITLLPVSAFYAIPWGDWRNFFLEDPEESDLVMRLVRDSYGVHTWNLHSSKAVVDLCSRQPFARLAHFHCPAVSDLAGRTM